MFSLVYASEATAPFSAEALRALLAVSRRNNADSAVTGMLLYKDGQFVQVLEGDEDVVRDLFDLITGDARHREVRILLESAIEDRHFPEWTMGYRQVSEDADADGYDRFLEEWDRTLSSSWASPSRARLLLDWFRTHRL
ncbi:MAG: hypothetical protein JWP66_1546 [Naasia sp.]|nr:hypothetical protein [Naasia sp.]